MEWYISSRFFENQPNEICSHLSEKASKGRFLKPEKLQNHSNEGKGKEKKKERGEEKKAVVALLVFTIATLEEKLLDAKGLFGDNVITKLIAAYNNFREKESDLEQVQVRLSS